MKTRVITLNTEGERFSRFKKNAKKYNIDYKIEIGVNATKVGPNDKMIDLVDEKLPGFTKGMLGCTLSHMKLIKECSEQDEVYLIFEDDASFLPNIDLQKAKTEFIESEFGIMHLQTNDLRKFSSEDEGVVRCKRRTSISTCAYMIKPEAARRLLGFCKKNDKGQDIALCVIDRFFMKANDSGLRMGVILPLMVCHSGIDTIVANSSYLVPLPEEKILTLTDHRLNAIERLKLEVTDNTQYGLKVNGIKVKIDEDIFKEMLTELSFYYQLELLEEEFGDEKEMYDALGKKIVLPIQEYKILLAKTMKRYNQLKKNIKKRNRAILEAKTIEEIFKAILIEL